MNIYQDSDSFWHDVPTYESKPSSNNGWIYTAYSKYLAPGTIDPVKVTTRFNGCLRSRIPLKIDRLPGKLTPPISKDEIVGIVSLGFDIKKELKNNYWNYNNLPEYEQKPLTISRIIKAVKALWKIRKEHRNYVWQNKIVDAYPLAFRLDYSERYYIKRMYGERTILVEKLHFHLSAINTYLNGKSYSRMMLWLQLKDLNHPWEKKVPLKTWVRDYLGHNHPFFTKNFK